MQWNVSGLGLWVVGERWAERNDTMSACQDVSSDSVTQRLHASENACIREYLVMFWRFLPPSTPPVAKWIGTPLTKVPPFLQSYPPLCQVPGYLVVLTAQLWYSDSRDRRWSFGGIY